MIRRLYKKNKKDVDHAPYRTFADINIIDQTPFIVYLIPRFYLLDWIFPFLKFFDYITQVVTFIAFSCFKIHHCIILIGFLISSSNFTNSLLRKKT